jgi:hypothetical protein
MQPTKELIDELYRERVEKARQMSPEEKFFGGARLFDRSCRIMADGPFTIELFLLGEDAHDGRQFQPIQRALAGQRLAPVPVAATILPGRIGPAHQYRQKRIVT